MPRHSPSAKAVTAGTGLLNSDTTATSIRSGTLKPLGIKLQNTDNQGVGSARSLQVLPQCCHVGYWKSVMQRACKDAHSQRVAVHGTYQAAALGFRNPVTPRAIQ